MKFNIIINNHFSTTKEEIESIINNYKSINSYISKGTRNSIKKIELKSGEISAVKSFKIPNIVNKFIYRFFRKSKAERSFEYANKLIDLGFKTPLPIAYVENKTTFNLLDSFYFSELVESDFLFRDLIETINFPETNEILKQFTKFTYDLHEAGIEFLDHSPGNTLIKKAGENKYDFYLVDLNRMNFHTNMSFEVRMKNFCRLSPHKDIVKIMAKEYAILINKPTQKVFDAMWNKTEKFQEKYYAKQRRKKKLKALVGK